MVRIIKTRDLGLSSAALGSDEWADGIAYPAYDPPEEPISSETNVTGEELEAIVKVFRQQRGPVQFGKRLA